MLGRSKFGEDRTQIRCIACGNVIASAGLLNLALLVGAAGEPIDDELPLAHAHCADSFVLRNPGISQVLLPTAAQDVAGFLRALDLDSNGALQETELRYALLALWDKDVASFNDEFDKRWKEWSDKSTGMIGLDDHEVPKSLLDWVWKTVDKCQASGWLSKRGPSSNHRFLRRWFALRGNVLNYYQDETLGVAKGEIILQACSTTSSFNDPHSTTGDSKLYCKTRPFGFTLDVDPNSGQNRRVFYLDAGNAEAFRFWTEAIQQAVWNLKEKEGGGTRKSV